MVTFIISIKFGKAASVINSLILIYVTRYTDRMQSIKIESRYKFNFSIMSNVKYYKIVNKSKSLLKNVAFTI